MINDEQCKEFIDLFLSLAKSTFKHSKESIQKEIESVKIWVDEIDERGLKYKLECLAKCIKYIQDDIKEAKYDRKIFNQDRIPERIKFFSWPNMKRMMGIASMNKNDRKEKMLNKRADKEIPYEIQLEQDKKYKLRRMFEKYIYEVIKNNEPEFYEMILNKGIDNIPDDYVRSYMKVQSNIIKIKKGVYEYKNSTYR
jgi:hypothetical protein